MSLRPSGSRRMGERIEEWQSDPTYQAERASLTSDDSLRSHGSAIQNTATIAVILDAFMLNHAIIPDRERAAGPCVSGGRLWRLDHVKQNAKNILTHDPADAFDVAHVGFVHRDPLPTRRRMNADKGHLERRHAHPCVSRFLRIEISVGDMSSRIRRLNDRQRFK